MKNPKKVALGLDAAGSAFVAIYFLKPGLIPPSDLASLAIGLSLLAAGGVALWASTSAPKVPCWFCLGRIGKNEFDHGIARKFPGPRRHIAFPAHNECAEWFVVGVASTETWQRVIKLHPELLGSNGFAPPPAPPAIESPATPGPPAPAVPEPAPLTAEHEAILRVVRAAAGPVKQGTLLELAGLGKNKYPLVRQLSALGLVKVEGGKWPEPNLVSAVREAPRD